MPEIAKAANVSIATVSRYFSNPDIVSQKSKDKIKLNPLSEFRYMPEAYSSRTALRVYDDKVAILLLSKDEPMAIVIKNNLIANGYRKYFEFMWKAASL